MKKICNECGNIMEENFDFCPYCSQPISDRAKMLEKQKAINAQLVLIASLMKEVSDTKTLKILNEYAKKLAQK